MRATGHCRVGPWTFAGNEMPSVDPTSNPCDTTWRERLNAFYKKVKSLQGDPHYVALGMAIGVFVGVTPTVPLHTAIALALAFLFKASKPAAAIGVWFGNPLTIPAFYYGSYKIGMLLLRHQAPLSGLQPGIHEMLKMGLDVTISMILGGAILGILPAVTAYFITLKLSRKIRLRRLSSNSDGLDADREP